MVVPRLAHRTVGFVDEYCEAYRNLFSDVRSFECFKYLHVGLISEIARKSLPAIAQVVGLKDSQNLHHFLHHAVWDTSQLRARRLQLVKRVLGDRSIILIIDETGDRKKGNATDYVAKQYIGNLGKTANGIVSSMLMALWAISRIRCYSRYSNPAVAFKRATSTKLNQNLRLS